MNPRPKQMYTYCARIMGRDSVNELLENKFSTALSFQPIRRMIRHSPSLPLLKLQRVYRSHRPTQSIRKSQQEPVMVRSSRRFRVRGESGFSPTGCDQPLARVPGEPCIMRLERSSKSKLIPPSHSTRFICDGYVALPQPLDSHVQGWSI